MTICARCGSQPCVCVVSPAPAVQWVVGFCQHYQTCGVRIRYRAGTETDPLCQWCRATDQHGSPYALYQQDRREAQVSKLSVVAE